MRKNVDALWLVTLWIVLALAASTACRQPPSEPSPESLPAGLGEVVAGYTSGAISREATLRVRFTEPVVAADAVGKELAQSPLSITPALPGAVLWKSRDELELRPSSPLGAGVSYSATLALGQLFPGRKVPQSFTFTFVGMVQSFSLSLEGLTSIDAAHPERQRLTGVLATGDAADNAGVEGALRVRQGKKELEALWEHADDRRKHRFIVDGVRREEAESDLLVAVDGGPLGVERNEEQRLRVPGLNSFVVVQTRVLAGSERGIEVRFSDPLAKSQSIKGLVRVGEREDLRFVIDGNALRIHTSGGWAQTERVTVSPGVKNARGQKLLQEYSTELSFEALKPAARFATPGVILPTSRGLTVPIEVANLRALRVEAYQVYTNNLAQFLQVNDLGSDNEIQRVGRLVWRRTIPLEIAQASDAWHPMGLDLTPLTEKFPNGMFRLKLSFARNDVLADCGESAPPVLTQVEEPIPEDTWYEATESTYWDYWDGGDEAVPYWEAYEHRFDPCHVGYFRKFGDHDITASRNVLISDVGLVVKRGSDDSLLAVTTDLKAAKPLGGARVRVLDFQQQEIARGETGSDGTLRLTVPRKPFVVLAEHERQVAVVKLDDGQTLALGHFDVGGTQVAKGLKGMLFGERGVWRPGDPIHLFFLLHDPAHRVPQGHPVHFELISSRGQIVDRQVRAQSVHGFYAFPTRTRADAQTGSYTARVRVGGATFEMAVPVETVLPNRLKIELDFGTELVRGPKAELEAKLASRWLHGASAGGLQVEMESRFSPVPTRFTGWDGFSFDDPARTYAPESRQIFSGRLDENGETPVALALDAGGTPPGMLSASFTTRVFEPSGAFSIDRHSVAYSPYARYVGLKLPKGDKVRGMLLTDIKHPVELALVDANGKPQSGEVELKLYKINWRWWWEKGEEQLVDYAGSTSYTPIAAGKAQVKNGKGTWPFEIKYPDWGRYLVVATDPGSGHRTGRAFYCDWPGWAGRAQKDQPGGASVLAFTPDQSEYAVGDTVTLTVPTAKHGRGLLSLETGSRVLSTRWIEPEGESTRVRFEATPDMAPTVYAHVTYLQPHGASGNDLPIRLYGITPIKVVDPATELAPVIESAATFAPETNATIAIREAKGRPMGYTLVVVDEGLLGLTRFRTPDPWSHFYGREALGVRTWDMYAWVAGSFGGAFERLLAIGGGDEGTEPTAAKAQRFVPVVRVLGPFALAAGETAKHAVPIPQYVGAVRIMVVAGRDGAFGSAEREVPVKKPLMVAATLPRVVGPGERVTLPVSVFALEPHVTSANVRLTTSGPLAIVGAAQQRLAFKKPGDQLAAFTLDVKDEIGVGEVTVTAEGAGEKATAHIAIDVRLPTTRVVDVLAAVVGPGKTWNESLKLPGVRGTNTAMLEVSRVPPIDLGSRLDSLIHYPHGCVEQTTSGAFPQVYLSKLLDLNPQRSRQVSEFVTAGITRLQGYQNATGGFSYWPGTGPAHDWSTSYVGHFLLEAKRAGFLPPATMLAQWTKYQRTLAQSWAASATHADLEQAYRLYTLALAGAPELGAMNRLKEQRLSAEARWRLAAAYKLAGQPEVARELIRGLSTEISSYRELGYTFGSSLRDRAMILETLVLLGDASQAHQVAKKVAEELASGHWGSTQEIAYSLVAMARFAETASTADGLRFRWSLAGKGGEVESTKPLAQVELAPGAHAQPALAVVNQGKGSLFIRVILSGLPATGKETSGENGLSLQIAYVDEGGNPVDPLSLTQGTDFRARVTVQHVGATGAYKELALSHLVPSGWEIHNERLGGGSTPTGLDYQDIRDDRVYTYFDLSQGEAKTIELSLNASYLGRFYLPMISVEAMYDASIQARARGQWIQVVPVENTN